MLSGQTPGSLNIKHPIHSFQSRDYNGYLAGKKNSETAKMGTNSGHLRAVQPTQLGSPSTTDHTTIARQRYLEKNCILKTCDPFTAPANIFISITSSKSLPELQFGDIYIYLIENPSPYTPQKLKAYQKHRGWVHNDVVWKVKTNKLFIIRAKMIAI